MAVIKNKRILKCLLMMVVSLFLILNFSIGVSASGGYDRQEADACITISQRLSVKGGSEVFDVKLSRKKYPESAQHIEEAIKEGQPDTLTIDRRGASSHRKASLQGVNTGPDLIDADGNSFFNMPSDIIMYTCYENGIMVTLWNLS